jgi:hypothetical protein
MITRPSARRFIAMMTACALTLTGVVSTGIGGFPLLVVASIVVLGIVDASYHSFDRRHRAATIGVERSTAPYYDFDLG